ncbi:outer membrane porin GjpA [Mycobacterium sp.]|uniref:outer membrane porin GjpA n=1 Tax=Mycobacterium sp. TaxID=1785 RepID=UPI0031E0BA76
MEFSASRSAVTSGVALAGAALIAVTPAAQSAPALPHVEVPAIHLTSGGDAIVPFPTLQHIIVNQAGYVDGLAHGTLTIQQVISDIGTNLGYLADGTILAGAPTDVDFGGTSQSIFQTILGTTLDQSHLVAFGEVVGTSSDLSGAEQLAVTLAASPLSGVLLGLLGPLLSPLVSLGDSVTAALGALSSLSLSGFLVNLITAPYEAINALFTGAEVNLDGLVPTINSSGLLPGDTTLTALNLELGGLLSTGVTASGGVAGLANSGVDEGIGGSLLNAYGYTTLQTGTDVGQAVGPSGAVASWTNLLAQLIGWDGVGNPLDALLADSSTMMSSSAADVSALAGDVSALAGDLASMF